MRPLLLALLVLGAAVRAEEFAQLMEDKAKKAEIESGLKILRAYFSAERDVLKGNSKAIDKRDKAMREFLDWTGKSKEKVGVDVAGQPAIFLEMFDRARVETLPTPAKGQLTWVDAGADRDFGYCFVAPKNYDQKNDARYPLVLTFHGRVIDKRHPAFKNDDKLFAQRSRAVAFDNWMSSAGREEAVVVAPTGPPIGFEFSKEDRWPVDVATLFQSLGEAMTTFRIDWNRVFLEVQGVGMRICCEYPLVFAGLIVRDGEIPRNEWVMLENLNGTPLCYVADQRKWDKGGKDLADALASAYAKAGAPQNLLVLQAQQNANGALVADDKAIVEFLKTHRRPTVRTSLHWRFFRDTMKNAGPCELDRANVVTRPDVDLAKHAGAVDYVIKTETFADESGNEAKGTRIEVSVTEAESLLFRVDEFHVPLDLPVTLLVNGEVIGKERQRIPRDLGYFMQNILPRRYFMLPYVAHLDANFKLKPQVEPEAPPVGQGGGEGAGEGGKPAEGEKPAEGSKPEDAPDSTPK